MRQRKNGFATRSWAWLSVVLAAGVWSSSSAFAQWENVYGSPCTRERGHGGVAPVVNCANGGYIAVGYKETNCGSGVYDSYVLRVNAAGATMWEETIDVTAFGGNDVAYSVVEIPAGGGPGGNGGFIVVGTVTEPATVGGSLDAYAMELDCNGNIIWVQTYGTGGVIDEARDITVAQNGFGPPPIPGGPAPAPGDYVIAGWTFGGLPVTQDAVLFRITPLGAVVWSQSYTANGADYLNAVIEARQANVGDIVAAGGTTSYGNGVQGLAIRVDGNTGLFTAAQHRVADHGGPSNEVFNNVTELSVAPNRGNLVFVGSTTLNAPTDIYAVETPVNPCNLIAQNVVTGAVSGDIDQAFDVIESPNNYFDAVGNLVVRRGDLALTGEASNGSQNTEMFLLTLNPANLNVAGVAKTYGDITPPGNGTLADGGRSLADDGSGFILCGYAMANFLFNADPEHFYMVKTTGAGVSNCENAWNPGNQSVTWGPGCQLPPTLVPFSNTPKVTTFISWMTWRSVCPRQPCIIKLPGNGQGNDGGHQGVSGVDPTTKMSSLRFYPNPVKKGGAVTLEFASAPSSAIEVTVTNGVGESVERMTTTSDGALTRFSFRTDDLSAGVYVVEVSDGTNKETVRIIVTD